MADPISTRQQLADAAVRAFLDGDDATRQHIVDELGERAERARTPADEHTRPGGCVAADPSATVEESSCRDGEALARGCHLVAECGHPEP